MRNLGHSSLQGYVFDIFEQFRYQVYNIKRNIPCQKLKSTFLNIGDVQHFPYNYELIENIVSFYLVYNTT